MLRSVKYSLLFCVLAMLLLSVQPTIAISSGSYLSLGLLSGASECNDVFVTFGAMTYGTISDIPMTSFDFYGVTATDADGHELYRSGGVALVGHWYGDDDWGFHLGQVTSITRRPITLAMWETTSSGGALGTLIDTLVFDPALYAPACSNIPGDFIAPNQISPTGIVTQTPAYTWTPVFGATWYQLWITTPDGYIAQWYEAANLCAGVTCSVTPAIIYSSGTYQWWVQAWSPTDGYSQWSLGLSFFYGALNTPTPVAPIGIVENTTPTFQWTQELGLTWYNLWVSFPNGGGAEYWYEASNVCSGGVCVAQPLTLVDGIYTWWVRGWGLDTYTAWSGANYFQLPLTVAVPTAPIGALADNNPTFVWGEVSSAYWYYLWVSGDPSGAVMDHWYNAYDICFEGECQVWEWLDLPPGNYVFWVQPWSPVAGYGPWSAPVYFNVTAPAPVESPPAESLPESETLPEGEAANS